MEILKKNCEEALTKDWADALDTCDQQLNYITKVSGGLLTFDNRIFDYDYKPKEQVVDDFFINSAKKQQIYKALNVDMSTKTPIYQHSSDKVTQAYKDEKMIDYAEWYDRMLELNIPVLIFAGEWDERCGASSMEAFLKSLYKLKDSNLWD